MKRLKLETWAEYYALKDAVEAFEAVRDLALRHRFTCLNIEIQSNDRHGKFQFSTDLDPLTPNADIVLDVPSKTEQESIDNYK